MIKEKLKEKIIKKAIKNKGLPFSDAVLESMISSLNNLTESEKEDLLRQAEKFNFNEIKKDI